jgi:aspartate/methionine/tyrosine aminotransferase
MAPSHATPEANPFLVDTGTPPIPEAKGWLASYDGSRGAVIDLSQAAPGHAPPPVLLRALAGAAADPATARYGPIRGEDSLRAAYARDLERAYGTPFNADDSVIVSGCNQAFLMAVLSVARAGDAVILPYPWYFNHKMALDMLGIETIPLPCRPENGFVPDVAEIAALMTKRTRAIALVTPNNPTGAVYPPATIRAVSECAQQHGLWLILDETYRDFLPLGQDRPHDLFASGIPVHVLQLYSFSKAYSLPGYRLGAISAPGGIMPELAKVLDTVQICPPRVGQIAVGSVMEETLAWREANRATIAGRAEAFRRALLPLNAWQIGSVGAYFAYVKPPHGAGDAAAFARHLAVNEGILALPGSYFGPDQEQWLRIAFANADEAQLATLGQRLGSAALPET